MRAGAAVGVDPVEYIGPERVVARVLVPGAPVRLGPLEYPEVAASGRVRACRFVPGAPVRAGPLEHLEVAALGRACAGPLVPGAAVGVEPRHDIKVAAFRCDFAHFFVPGITNGAGEREEGKGPATGRLGADAASADAEFEPEQINQIIEVPRPRHIKRPDELARVEIPGDRAGGEVLERGGRGRFITV